MNLQHGLTLSNEIASLPTEKGGTMDSNNKREGSIDSPHKQNGELQQDRIPIWTTDTIVINGQLTTVIFPNGEE